MQYLFQKAVTSEGDFTALLGEEFVAGDYTTTLLVLSDWLEDQGRNHEATLARRWANGPFCNMTVIRFTSDLSGEEMYPDSELLEDRLPTTLAGLSNAFDHYAAGMNYMQCGGGVSFGSRWQEIGDTQELFTIRVFPDEDCKLWRDILAQFIRSRG